MTGTVILFNLMCILFYSVFNRSRGITVHYPKVVWYFAMTMTFSVAVWANIYFIDLSILELIGYFLLTWVCFTPGWGRYFPHGNNYDNYGKAIFTDKEFLPVTIITNLIYKKWDGVLSKPCVKNWQTIAMSLRFFTTFGLLLYPYIMYILHETVLTISSLLVLFVGIIYRLNFKRYTATSIQRSELWAGAYLGLLTIITIQGY